MCDILRTMTDANVTGLDLKLARTRARVKAKRIALAMGVSSSRVAALEREAVVTPEAAERYFRAVAECRTDGTSEAVA
jgi:DNA-binding transcriptional regulator YiaG